ncbi:hypothetical protein H4582DRAFT_2076367 [Lactarius indigo]|nr:hypothetical protein H4582DRAFT_2076367 [Lactarius indigo]
MPQDMGAPGFSPQHPRGQLSEVWQVPLGDLPTRSRANSARSMRNGGNLPLLPAWRSRPRAGSHVSQSSWISRSHERPRSKSAPQKVQSVKDDDFPPSQPPQRSRAKSSVAPSSRSLRERPRVKSAPQKVPLMKDDEFPPLPPFQRSRTRSSDSPPSRSPRERPRVKSAPQKVRLMKDDDLLPLPPSQRSTAKPSVSTSSRSPRERSRVKSAPQKVRPVKDDDLLPLPPSQRSTGRPPVASSSRSRRTSAEHPRASPGQPTTTYPTRRPLNSTVRQVLPNDFKFRILVIGKSSSGKSSLIKAIFKVDATAPPERAPGKADINVEFRPGDNRYLIVHEYGLDSQASNPQDLQTIRDFVTHRTDPSRPPPERLHAVWICVPASDAIAGRLGDEVEEILSLRNVPVVVVFTKFDVVVSQVRLDSPDEAHERARTRAHTIYEDSCRRLFHKDPRDVPAEIVSGTFISHKNPRFIDLIDNLVVTTDRLITGSRGPSGRSSGQGTKQRVGAVPLAWSAALRVNHDIIIQASIEVGRSRYWRSLLSSLDFADQTLKNCVNIIHLDIVRIWNMKDKRRYLSSDGFKAKMSHLVKNLAGSTNTTPGSDPRAGDDYADWVHEVYRGSQENVRCIMGYIVDLTVILDGIFRIAAGDMSPNHAQQVFERHARSRHRDAIHREIGSFITEAFTHQIKYNSPSGPLVLLEVAKGTEAIVTATIPVIALLAVPAAAIVFIAVAFAFAIVDFVVVAIVVADAPAFVVVVVAIVLPTS